MVIRRGGPQDVRFLRDMLHHAYYWREREPGEGPGPVALYVKGWGRPGDTALIAIDEGFPVGAAWYRLFRREQPGYGFVDEETPELAIAVVPSRRGRGIGDALLKELYARAKKDGHRAVSLAAERDNAPLVSYYEQKHGFARVHEDGGDSVTMRREL
jgi:ribosomal protein S18 acetylase RimI-like enzyme